jgi:hypothetical protein
VKSIFVQYDFLAKPAGYPAITITAEDASQMASALAFTQKISAFPNSNLATSFTNLLTADADKTLIQMEDDVKQFFQTTPDYTNVDFASYMLASTYVSTFLPQWIYATDVPYLPAQADPPAHPQVYAHTEYSYWLYASTDMGGGSNGASAASCSGRVTFGVGTVSPPAGQSYSNNYPLTITGSPTDPNCGVKAYLMQEYYQIPTGTGTPLYFNNGQLVDDVNTPTICLQTGFALKSSFTRDITDTTLWPILTGTMGGAKVIGVPMRPEDAWDKFCNYWSSMTFDKFVQLFLTIMGVVMALDFIKTKLAGKERAAAEKQANESQGDPLTPDQEAAVETLGNQTEANAQADATTTAARMNDPDLKVPTEGTIAEVQGNISNQVTDANNSATTDSLNQTLTTDENTLETMGNLDNNQDAEQAGSDIVQANEDEGNISTEEADLKNISQDQANWVEDTAPTLGETAENTVKDAEALDKEVDDLETEETQENTNEASGDEGEGVDNVPVDGD